MRGALSRARPAGRTTAAAGLVILLATGLPLADPVAGLPGGVALELAPRAAAAAARATAAAGGAAAAVAAAAAPTVALVSTGAGGIRLRLELPAAWSATTSRAPAAVSRLVALPAGAAGIEVRSVRRLDAAPRAAPPPLAVTAGPAARLGALRVAAVRFQPPDSEPAAGVTRDRALPDAALSGAAPAAPRRLAVEVELGFTELAPDGGGVTATGWAAGGPRSVLPESFDRLYRGLVVNYDGPPAGVAVRPGTYLVICPDDATVTTRLEPLLDWRRRQGWAVRLATTAETGASATQIKTFIQALYDSAAPPLEYVCLVGDASGAYAVPTWFESLSGYHGEGDLPYALLAGDDILPDVHVGRLSVSSTQEIERIVSKIVNYERSPELGDPSWFTRGCVVGDPTDSGWSCVETGRWVKERLLARGYTEVDTVWASPFVSQIAASLNRGVTLFGYRGFWGMSGWGNGNTYALQNGSKLPFAVIVTCDTGSFASGTSRTEGFLRAGSGPDEPRGAIGAVGTATTGTHTRYNNCLYYGLFHGLLQEGLHTMGGALSRGRLELWLNYGESEPQNAEIWSHWNNLIGDPAVDVWTAAPAALTVVHPETVALGANALAVEVRAAGDPVAGARVCLLGDDGAQVAATTGASGLLELPIHTTGGGVSALQLTVTGHDLLPYLATIPVTAAPLYVGYAASAVDDDGTGSSAGNGDGIINPGESIELRVELENSGSNTAHAVTATLSAADPYVTVTDATESFGDLGAGASAWSLDDFDFTVAPGCPHDHQLRFALEVTASTGGPWHALIELPVVAATLRTTAVAVDDGGGNGNGRLDPGETAELTVTLANQGGATASGTSGTLRTLSPWITISDASGSFGTIAAGGSGDNDADRFTVTADPAAYAGYLASLELLTTFSGGVRDTSFVALTVGERAATDPIGPDAYGYLAFDDSDGAYPEAPLYAWVELDPNQGGSGTAVELGDYGDYQDAARVVELPFAFRYYGQSFTQATICSNGWLALGATYLTAYRNWTIPGAGGPGAMLAAFWDNLYQDGVSGVYQSYDTEHQRWIVEWSRMRNTAGNALETFEIILEDPAYHGTLTGDGVIEFQYDTISNTDGQNGYSTVGIESPDQLDGLLVSYWNQYPAGAAPLAAGRAIRFVPTTEEALGTLSGEARNASHQLDPVDGVEVEVRGSGRVFVSDAAGHFGGWVPPGSYTVIARHPSFAPDSLLGVVIEEAQTTGIAFELVDVAGPAITTTQHPHTGDEQGPYPIPVHIVEYSGLAAAALHVRLNGGTFSELGLAPLGGDDYLAEIPGQPFITHVEYYVEARDELGLESRDPPGAPGELFGFFVTPLEIVLDEPFELGGHGWTVGAPGDDATSGIWVREEPVGTIQGTQQVQPETDHSPDPAEICFVTGNAAPGQPAGTNDVDGGHTTLVSPLFDLSGLDTAELDYWVWYTNNRGGSPNQDYWDVDLTGDGSSWVTLEHTSVSTNAWMPRHFQLESYVPLGATMQLRFVAADQGGPSLVEAAVDDLRLSGMRLTVGVPPAGAAPPPARFALAPCRPNPFNPATTIPFELGAASRATLRIYDVRGRLVQTLVNRRLAAGRHAARWDGRNAAGQPAASGVYFMRLEAGSLRAVQRLALVR